MWALTNKENFIFMCIYLILFLHSFTLPDYVRANANLCGNLAHAPLEALNIVAPHLQDCS
jgi:hypothetical protein